MKPIAFKVRGGGNYSGTKGGAVRPNEKGGTGALWYVDKTFTLASTQDQFIATPIDQEHPQHSMTTQQSIPQVPLRFLSVCSGIEAASVAWEPLGWKAVGFSEIEPFPCAVLAHRFPNTPNYGSLTEYASWPIEPGSIDLLVGGTPCQSFSVAGLRKGMADPRGNLALVFLGLADRVKPRYIVWENVPGVLSSNGGRDFGSFLGALEQLGYGWAYRTLDAQHVGRCRMHAQGSGWDAVPQRRRRVFVVACLGAGGWESAAKVLFEPESLSGDTAKGRKKGQGVAADAQGGAGSSGCWWDGGQVSQTLDAVLAKGQTMPEKNRFPAVLQPIVIDRAAFNQGENAQFDPHIEQTDVMDPLVARGPHAVACATGDITHCLTVSNGATEDGTGRGTPIVNAINNFDLGDTRTTHAVVSPTITTCKGSRGGSSSEAIDEITAIHLAQASVAPTVTSSGPPYSRTGNERVEADALAITFQPGNLRREAGADPSTTTTTTLKASAGDQMPHVATPMAVRRLTPTECMRLQGFPDDWARIPWKGKPADQCPDGPQYKAAGNSMAVPVMRWIGSRIAAVEQLSTQPTK